MNEESDAELEAEKKAFITASIVLNEELSEALQSIEWLTEQNEAAYRKVGYQAQRAEQAEKERDLAIAHDRQPYPTADAYEKVCEALHKTEAELAERDKMLRLAFGGPENENPLGFGLWLADLRKRAKAPREPLPGEVDAYMAEEHAKARAEEGGG